MKEVEQQAVRDLIRFYMHYVKNGADEALRKMARETEQKYLNAFALIPDDVDQALGVLVDFYAETGIQPISKAKAKELLAMLQKRRK